LKRPSSKGATYIKKKWVDQAVAAAAYGDQMQSYIKKTGTSCSDPAHKKVNNPVADPATDDILPPNGRASFLKQT